MAHAATGTRVSHSNPGRFISLVGVVWDRQAHPQHSHHSVHGPGPDVMMTLCFAGAEPFSRQPVGAQIATQRIG